MELEPQPQIVVHDPVEDAMARALTQPGVAIAIANHDLKAYRDALTGMLPSEPDATTREAIQRLLHTRRPFARRLRNRLPLWLTTFAGCGFRLIGEDDRLASTYATVRWITLFFLPVWPLCGYIVRERHGYTYEFLAEIPFDRRHRWALLVLPVVVALLAWVRHTRG